MHAIVIECLRSKKMRTLAPIEYISYRTGCIFTGLSSDHLSEKYFSYTTTLHIFKNYFQNTLKARNMKTPTLNDGGLFMSLKDGLGCRAVVV